MLPTSKWKPMDATLEPQELIGRGEARRLSLSPSWRVEPYDEDLRSFSSQPSCGCRSSTSFGSFRLSPRRLASSVSCCRMANDGSEHGDERDTTCSRFDHFWWVRRGLFCSQSVIFNDHRPPACLPILRTQSCLQRKIGAWSLECMWIRILFDENWLGRDYRGLPQGKITSTPLRYKDTRHKLSLAFTFAWKRTQGKGTFTSRYFRPSPLRPTFLVVS